MKEFCRTLKTLADRYPGTMSDLARKAHIDRSTLYKIIDGKRTPNEKQLRSLVSALCVTPEQGIRLMNQYANLRTGASDLQIYAEVHALVNALFHVQDKILHAGGLQGELDNALPGPPQPGSWTGRREVNGRLSALLKDYLDGGDERPLMLSPLTGGALDQVIINAFVTAGGAPKALWQLLLFRQGDDGPSEQTHNLRVMTRTLPFLFLERMRYEARLVNGSTDALLPAALLPVYLLFPNAAVMLDENCQKAVCVTDPAVVECLRLEFSRQYFAAPSLLVLTTQTHDYRESIAINAKLIAPKPKMYLLRHQPPLSQCIDREIIREFMHPQMTDTPDLPQLLQYLYQWNSLKTDAYFSEEGLLSFVRTGRFSDLPDLVYKPLTPAARRRVLQNLRAACMDEERTLRFIRPEAIRSVAEMNVAVFRGEGVIFCQTLHNDGRPDFCREYLMKDPGLTEALVQYCTMLCDSGMVHSQNYTVDFIDYCMQLL